MRQNDNERRALYIGVVLLLNVAGLIYYLWFFSKNGYLPSPFVYDKSDTFMDLFNPMSWSYKNGIYTEWKSVYPPLSFILLKLINFIFHGGGIGDAEVMRSHSTYVIMAIIIFYIISTFLIVKGNMWSVFSSSERYMLFIIIIASVPMLFSLERMNIILMCPIIISYLISSKSRYMEFLIAILINIKPYFIILAAYYLFRKEWRNLSRCVLISALIFVSTGLVLGGDFMSMIGNIFSFSNGSVFSLREVMSMPSSLSAFSYVLDNPSGNILAISKIGYDKVYVITYIKYAIEILIYSFVVSSLYFIYKRSESISNPEVFCVIIAIITNISANIGGYSLIFYVPFIPVFYKMRTRKIIMFIIALIAIPIDYIPIMSQYIGDQWSYLSDGYVHVHWTLSIGEVVRPLANMALLICITYDLFSRSYDENISISH